MWEILILSSSSFKRLKQPPKDTIKAKGPVKLMKRVKIAHSFSQSVSNQFLIIILCLPIWFYKWLSKNFLKSTSKNGEIGHVNL